MFSATLGIFFIRTELHRINFLYHPLILDPRLIHERVLLQRLPLLPPINTLACFLELARSARNSRKLWQRRCKPLATNNRPRVAQPVARLLRAWALLVLPVRDFPEAKRGGWRRLT